jgi:hypothetical protein
LAAAPRAPARVLHRGECASVRRRRTMVRRGGLPKACLIILMRGIIGTGFAKRGALLAVTQLNASTARVTFSGKREAPVPSHGRLPGVC